MGCNRIRTAALDIGLTWCLWSWYGNGKEREKSVGNGRESPEVNGNGR